ncbi:hypothetical protein FHR81_002078 [Actinoalloteichus hoggarensis]|uniref:Stress responsive A/B Barrel Domain protein n=1 Tax=Actinoalloteichus hoggarensis TaxID=1470176 RepID=A0A221W5X3_9PSEU|nr:Dabb family protein [Actinoalloteichus hoggarensis]ASO21111.1 Stress responsive A/B Barrel Domain protein [Actinoalloteichus hoggarensis]MBB5921040.1 hypothetical protein [Actinoalloteichus hoggarensis]
MIYHGIRFTIRPDVSRTEAEAVLERMLEGCRRMVPSRTGVLGRDFGGEYEYGAVAVFEDLESYERMLNDPAYLEVDLIGLPLVDKFTSFDITDDPDPEFGAKLAEIHRRRWDKLPDLTRLVANLDEYTDSAAAGPVREPTAFGGQPAAARSGSSPSAAG